MGARGPIPKRSSERRRRNKPATPVTDVDMQGEVEMPAPDEAWHPIASAWYASLAESGQSRYYEPSDWAAACFTAEVMSRGLQGTHFSPSLFSAVWSAMGDLLSTEASRRRVQLEVVRRRAAPVARDDTEDVVERWRRELMDL